MKFAAMCAVQLLIQNLAIAYFSRDGNRDQKSQSYLKLGWEVENKQIGDRVFLIMKIFLKHYLKKCILNHA